MANTSKCCQECNCTPPDTIYIQVQHIKKTYSAALASCIIQVAQGIMGSLVKTQPGAPLLVNNSECHKQWLFNAQCTLHKETNYFKRLASTHLNDIIDICKYMSYIC